MAQQPGRHSKTGPQHSEDMSPSPRRAGVSFLVHSEMI